MDSRTPAVSNASCQQQTPHLRLVAVADSPDYAAFVAEVLRDEERERERAITVDDWSFSDLDDRLLAAGFPVAFLVGGDLPDFDTFPTPEEDKPPVTDIRIAKLHRYLRKLPPLESKMIRLFWGIDCEPHTQAEIAAEVKLSQPTVSRTLAHGMAALCQRFEVPPDIAA